MLASLHDTNPSTDTQAENWIWWKHGVIYQILVRSFYDADGDGNGDLQGIISKLDYLESLGITAIWLTPIFESPMYDQGYDVRDYLEIDPRYGTLEDLTELIEKAHERGIRIILDLVLNHTSNFHPWFLESRSSISNPKRDWYIWQDPVNGGPPSNWRSAYGGSAWEWDEKTQQYYLHSFFKEQPDLNWRNKALREEFFEIMRYWLDIGIDGFRLDVINAIVKDKKFRDNPWKFSFPFFQEHLFNRNRPKSFKIVKSLRKVVDDYDDRMLVGEVYTLPPGDAEVVSNYLGKGDDGLHIAFDFSLIFSKWNARKYYKAIKQWYKHIPHNGWPCHVLSNHDLHRSFNRYGILRDKADKAKLAAVLLLTLKGTPFLYYGEEIGMENIKLKRRDINDPVGKKYWPIYSGRDQARTPMQWNEEENAGFTSGLPWLKVNPGYKDKNVALQSKDPDSIFNTYKNLIHLRQKFPALQSGKWKPVNKGYSGILSYYRTYGDQMVFVVLNFTSSTKKIDLPHGRTWKNLYSTKSLKKEKLLIGRYKLEPYEAMVLEGL